MNRIDSMKQIAGSGSTQYQSGRDMTINHISKGPQSRLTKLFEKLNQEFNADNQITDILDELESFTTDRDVIGLEQKLIDGGKEHLFEDVSWFKQEYVKKLEKFQYYPSAQKIHALVLAAVLDKFWNCVRPLIRSKANEDDIFQAIDKYVIDPIFDLIESSGAEDIMGLSRMDINGMIFYLTGKCHIKWK